MTSGSALLRAIEASPDDDTVRLVYADWLEEHADSEADSARAEFIRLQCQAGRPGKRQPKPKGREAELLQKFGPVWRNQYGASLLAYDYRRGFVDPVYLRASNFSCHADKLAAVTPLHRVQLFKTPVGAAALASCPQLAFVRSLDLTSNVIRNDHLAALVRSSHLVNLTAINLSRNHVGVAGCEALAVANFPALRTLILDMNPIKDRGLAALLSARWLAGLTRLSLQGRGLWVLGPQSLRKNRLS